MASNLRSIKSAHRVLEILEYFDRDHPTATVMDLSRALDYPQSSTSELLRCLAHLGYLRYNRFRRTYSPSARVALLGCWVEPTLFRGGAVLKGVDTVAESVGETVMISTATNYQVQHLHVVDGHSPHAVSAHAGVGEPLLHSPQGELILSSYSDEHIRSALHRLNAEEIDPARRVRVCDKVAELVKLRRQGAVICSDMDGTGVGTVAALLPPRGSERLVLSVLAPTEIIEERGEEMLQIVLAQRDAIFSNQRQAKLAPQPSQMQSPYASAAPHAPAANPAQMQPMHA